MTGDGPTGVAVVGCGDISRQYLTHLAGFPEVEVLFCADLDPERARARAEAFGIPAWGSLEGALAEQRVELVVNLTPPATHGMVATATLDAGKHVWNEKPLATDLGAASALLTRAAERGLRVGGAPDTVLGAGLQTARRLVLEGAIGEPVAATTMVQGMGPDHWHPQPETFYRRGAGPLFDLGPYYLTTLCVLLGPVRRVAALGRQARAVRTIPTGERAGTAFGVEVPTHVTALLDFESGPSAMTGFSFDSPHRRTEVEIVGTEGTLGVPDPNRFDGTVLLHRRGAAEAEEIPCSGTTAGRGIGVVDLVEAVRAGRPHRASAELALHVLETMLAIERSAASGGFVDVDSRFVPPAPVEAGWDPAARGTEAGR
ncbi:MAG: Gfo/Idh/MocA family protein [Candidatus Dormibacteraceae bacterium]